MSKKTKKHISRNNNSNRLTRYRGGSNGNNSKPYTITGAATGAVGLAAQGTGALVKGVAKYTGAKAIGEGAVGLGKGAIGAVDSGMNYVSKEVQESAVKGAEEIGKFKQSVKDFASSEKTKEITGKVFDTLTGERLIKNEQQVK